MISYVEVILIINLFISLIIMFSMKKRKTVLYKLFKILFSLIQIFIISSLALTLFNDNVTDVNSLMYVDSISYIATCNLPVFFLFIALKYKKKYFNLKKLWCLFIIPIISLIIIFTNQFHHLFCIQYSMDVSQVEFGSYFYIHTVYTYLLLIISFAIIIKSSIDKSGFLSVGTVLIIIGSLSPIIPSILGVLQIVSIETYITPMMFLITAICFYISIFKLKVLDTVPIALKNIMDIMTDSFIVIEKDGSVGYINKTFNNIVADFINLKTGDNLYDKIRQNKLVQKNIEDIEKTIENAKETNKLTLYTLKIMENIQLKKCFEINCQPINTPKGKKEYIGTLMIFRDITENVKSKDIISNQKRLTNLGETAGNMAHGINTPISTIDYAIDYLHTSILEQKIKCIEIVEGIKKYIDTKGDTKLNTSIEDLMKIICLQNDDSVETLEKMKYCTTNIKTIVNSARNQIRNIKNTEKVWFNLNNIIDGIIAIVGLEAQKTGCELNINVNKDIELFGEKNKFEQVLINLITNSVQAYEDNNLKGSVIVNGYMEEDNIIIEIIDKAGGIPERLQDTIFKEALTTKGTRGTGIGLTIAYSIIKGNFGGELSFVTENGVGTEFIIKIKNERND